MCAICPPSWDIRQATELASTHLDETEQGCAAIILVTKRAGLTNAKIALCHRICHIPANSEYSSLNVAQALQLAAQELRYALLRANGNVLLPKSTAQEPRTDSQPASGKALAALLAQWEQALIGVQFLDPTHPKN